MFHLETIGEPLKAQAHFRRFLEREGIISPRHTRTHTPPLSPRPEIHPERFGWEPSGQGSPCPPDPSGITSRTRASDPLRGLCNSPKWAQTLQRLAPALRASKDAFCHPHPRHGPPRRRGRDWRPRQEMAL